MPPLRRLTSVSMITMHALCSSLIKEHQHNPSFVQIYYVDGSNALW